MPRNGLETKKKILDAANRLFYSEGIRAVSVDAVAEKAGITKKSLYYHFKSKDDLVTEYLVSRDQPSLQAFQEWYNAAEGEIADKVTAIFENVAKNAHHPRWRGCGFLRTVVELADKPGHPAVKAGAAHKKRFEQWLACEFSSANVKTPDDTARTVVLLLEGAFAISMFHKDPDYILQAGKSAHGIVASVS